MRPSPHPFVGKPLLEQGATFNIQIGVHERREILGFGFQRPEPRRLRDAGRLPTNPPRSTHCAAATLAR